jgi:hypothetical protein
MKRFACVLMLLAVVFTAGSALALNLNDHVTLAPNEKGDLLFIPLYVALDGGWETKINVINTSFVYPVVAKVVIRSMVYSRELLDFFIYLSPTDVWTGTLRQGANGPEMFSTDDSVLSTATTFASPASPFEQILDPFGDLCSDDTANFGYVEIFEAWSTLDGPATAHTTIPVDKAEIKSAFEAATTFSLVLNSLTANFELINSLAGFTAAQDATILKDYNVTARLTLGAETFIGQLANNDMCEVEAALSRNNLAMYYYNSPAKLALHAITFPTKLTQNANCGACEDVLSEFFFDNYLASSCWGADYGQTFFDLSEHSLIGENPIVSPPPVIPQNQFLGELNFTGVFIDNELFLEGWSNYKFIKANPVTEDPVSTTCAPLTTADTITFTGAPVIGTTLFLGVDGLSLMGSASDLGAVTYAVGAGAAAPVTYYQLKEGGDPVL